MDLDIIKIASDTTNNKILKDYTHRSKYKNKTCGDIIEMRVNIKKNIIQDIGSAVSYTHLTLPTIMPV